MFTNLVKKGLSRAAFIAAAAFYWGASEGLLNRWRPPRGVWQPDNLLESVFGRAVFYAALVLVVVLAVALVRAVVGALRREKGIPEGTRGWRGAVAAAAIAAAAAGWFAAGTWKDGIIKIGNAKADLGRPTAFAGYWLLFAALGVVLAILLIRFVAGRRWWRTLGRYAAVAGAAAFVVVVAGRHAARALRPVPHGPNVVLIVLDAWRADAFREALMPHLYDYAERDAVTYTRVWSSASWTSPSMGSIFTGQYADAHRFRLGPGRDEVSPTLAQIFREAGYDTTAFVANRLIDRHHPIVEGFDDYTYWSWPPFLQWTHFFHTNWYGPAARDVLHDKLCSDTSRKLTLMLGRYLARPHERPYFLWVHYMDPHTPYTPPPGYYRPDDEKFIKSYRPNLLWRRQAYHRLYEGECTFVDDLLAPMVLPTLEADENTIVVITSDHGEEFMEHGEFEHGKTVYEAALRVPLILSIPGVEPAVVTTPVSQLDLTPTILKYAGLEVPETMQGLPLPLADSAEPPRPIFVGSEFTKPRIRGPREDAIIVWPHKLIVKHEDMAEGGKYYNVRTDAGESNPLAEDETAARLRARIQSWKKTVKKRGRPDLSTIEDVGAADAADLRALGYIQ
jgi:arylsulfatase A-like enzyme